VCGQFVLSWNSQLEAADELFMALTVVDGTERASSLAKVSFNKSCYCDSFKRQFLWKLEEETSWVIQAG
jgi:hypothetical protein